jgi:hypothetical protein
MAADHTEVRAKSAELAAATVMKINLTGGGTHLRITNREDPGGTYAAADDIWFTIDGSELTLTTPTVGGDDCHVSLNNSGSTIVPIPPMVQGSVWVGLIATGTPLFTVELLDERGDHG